VKIAVHMPTRSRPERCIAKLEAFRRLSSKQHEIKLSVAIDEDDQTMRTDHVRRRLAAANVRVHVGAHQSKVEACNAGIDRDFDVLVLASDDMTCCAANWDIRVLELMVQHFPNFDGALHFNDGHVGEKLCTLPIMGVNLFKKLGYVYHPDYLSLCCDDEYTELFKAQGRLVYSPTVIVRHDHHSFGRGPKDALARRNDALMERDKEVYLRRKATVRPGAPWGFDAPPILLSVLVASLRQRTEFLRQLLAQLNDQINSNPILREVEIIVDRDNGEATIGAKRQRMLERAKGDYIAFIDDDDEISPRYIRLVTDAIKDRRCHCANLVGEITVDGRDPRTFLHSIKFSHWYEENRIYYRTPNHLNPVRRELALQAGFGDERFGEDHAYSNRLAGILRALPGGPIEAQIGECYYWYRCRSKK
jgi:hypothetical protein